MKSKKESSTEIPCYKCVFWDSVLYCNPNECQELTEWLLKQMKKYQETTKRLKQTVETLKVQIKRRE